MDLQKFQHEYAKFGSHDHIKINCDRCGNEFGPLKTRAQQTIKKNGKYLCRSCGQIEKHASSPPTSETKEKIGKGVHEHRFLRLIEELEPMVGSNKIKDWEIFIEENGKEGILWAVQPTKNHGDIIVLHLFFWIPSSKIWCWKEIDEMEGPVAVCCPLRFFQKTSTVDSTWRKAVREFWKENEVATLPQVISDWVKRQQ
jgi:hypothetical protein